MTEGFSTEGLGSRWSLVLLCLATASQVVHVAYTPAVCSMGAYLYLLCLYV